MIALAGKAATGPGNAPSPRNPTAPSPLLSIESLHVHFEAPHGTVRAVDGVSLSVNHGARVGVVGESGSGKTQTFFSLFGLVSGSPGVVSGRARLNGHDLLHGPDHPVQRGSRAIEHAAILFQDPKRALIPYWTIGQHLRDVASRRPPQEQPAALLAALGLRDTTRILNAFPEQLSGGEAQRALLAITMAMRPQLLVADEPTTGLDTINQNRALDALRDVHARGNLALVLISHDLAVVDALVDDVIVMYAGRVVQRLSATQLRAADDHALHPYTSALRESQRRRAIGAPISTEAFKSGLERARTGCAYRSRCALRAQLSASLQQRCDSEPPPETPARFGGSIACWGRRP